MKPFLGIMLAVLCVAASAQSRLSDATSETFQQLAELTGSQPYALASTSVAISGNTLVIGAPGATPPNGCFECGAAYVYTAVNGDWTNLTLTATLSETGAGAGFGAAVAISGDTIVVGSGAGVAYVYSVSSGTVAENAELTTSGPPNEGFNSISIDGNTIVAGSPLAQVGNEKELGSAYVYVQPSGGWENMTQTALLVANDASIGCYFGNSVGISGNTIVIGAPRSDANGLSERGRAYVFVKPAEGWSGTKGQTAELDPSDGTKKAYFGLSVSISGGNVVVGGPQQTIGLNGTQGAVYVYTRPLDGWPRTMTETAELTAIDGKAGSELGYSVAISGATLLAGAADAHNHEGVAYVFSEPSGGWQTGSGGVAVGASDAEPDDGFGNAVGIGGGVLAVSASGWQGGIGGDGAIYVFGKSQ